MADVESVILNTTVIFCKEILMHFRSSHQSRHQRAADQSWETGNRKFIVNYHLLADINGKERKFIIGKNKPEYSMIQSAGTSSLTDKQLKEMCEKYF